MIGKLLSEKLPSSHSEPGPAHPVALTHLIAEGWRIEVAGKQDGLWLHLSSPSGLSSAIRLGKGVDITITGRLLRELSNAITGRRLSS